MKEEVRLEERKAVNTIDRLNIQNPHECTHSPLPAVLVFRIALSTLHVFLAL